MKRIITSNLILALCAGFLLAVPRPMCSLFGLHISYFIMALALLLSVCMNAILMRTYHPLAIRKPLAISFAAVMSVLAGCAICILLAFVFRHV